MDFSEQQKKQKKKNGLMIFIIAFILAFLGLMTIVSNISPDVDVTIGDENKTEESPQDKQNVDERLRWIQLEDNMPGVSNRFSSEEQTEGSPEYVNPSQKEEKLKKEAQKKEMMKQEKEENSFTQVQLQPQSTMVKVYVGKFSTVEQAISMQNRLMEADMGLMPFVKSMADGSFVVQVGSYGSQQKAQTMHAELQAKGFPARIIKE